MAAKYSLQAPKTAAAGSALEVFEGLREAWITQVGIDSERHELYTVHLFRAPRDVAQPNHYEILVLEIERLTNVSTLRTMTRDEVFEVGGNLHCKEKLRLQTWRDGVVGYISKSNVSNSNGVQFLTSAPTLQQGNSWVQGVEFDLRQGEQAARFSYSHQAKAQLKEMKVEFLMNEQSVDADVIVKALILFLGFRAGLKALGLGVWLPQIPRFAYTQKPQALPAPAPAPAPSPPQLDMLSQVASITIKNVCVFGTGTAKNILKVVQHGQDASQLFVCKASTRATSEMTNPVDYRPIISVNSLMNPRATSQVYMNGHITIGSLLGKRAITNSDGQELFISSENGLPGPNLECYLFRRSESEVRYSARISVLRSEDCLVTEFGEDCSNVEKALIICYAVKVNFKFTSCLSTVPYLTTNNRFELNKIVLGRSITKVIPPPSSLDRSIFPPPADSLNATTAGLAIFCGTRVLQMDLVGFQTAYHTYYHSIRDLQGNLRCLVECKTSGGVPLAIVRNTHALQTIFYFDNIFASTLMSDVYVNPTTKVGYLITNVLVDSNGHRILYTVDTRSPIAVTVVYRDTYGNECARYVCSLVTGSVVLTMAANLSSTHRALAIGAMLKLCYSKFQIHKVRTNSVANVQEVMKNLEWTRQ